jgi:hypothetical protein
MKGAKKVWANSPIHHWTDVSGYGAFAPVIDTFLKEHLFADIYDGCFNLCQRELVTISVLSAVAGRAYAQSSTICLKVGLTPEQLTEFGGIIQPSRHRRSKRSNKIFG